MSKLDHAIGIFSIIAIIYLIVLVIIDGFKPVSLLGYAVGFYYATKYIRNLLNKLSHWGVNENDTETRDN